MRLPEPAATADTHTQQSAATFVIPPISQSHDYLVTTTSSCPKILATVARRSPEFRGGAAGDETIGEKMAAHTFQLQVPRKVNFMVSLKSYRIQLSSASWNYKSKMNFQKTALFVFLKLVLF